MDNELRGIYPVNSQIKFKTTILKSSLCDYIYIYCSDIYILVKWKIRVNNTGTVAAPTNRNEK